jgi:hypothetical protein
LQGVAGELAGKDNSSKIARAIERGDRDAKNTSRATHGKIKEKNKDGFPNL